MRKYSLDFLFVYRVGRLGQSGSGKSMVISLIERFYDPKAGEVLIDNINLKEFQLKWIRQKIGLLSQEPILFTSNIKDNILYGIEGIQDTGKTYISRLETTGLVLSYKTTSLVMISRNSLIRFRLLITINAMAEEDGAETFNDSPGAILVNLLTSLQYLPMGMHSLLIVMALTWGGLSWQSRGDAAAIHAYHQGVREGAFGLLLNSEGKYARIVNCIVALKSYHEWKQSGL